MREPSGHFSNWTVRRHEEITNRQGEIIRDRYINIRKRLYSSNMVDTCTVLIYHVGSPVVLGVGLIYPLVGFNSLTAYCT